MNSQTQTESQDAIELLKADHRKVQQAFKEFEALDDKDFSLKQQIVATICDDLTAHMVAEEKVFYPVVAPEIKDGHDLINEAIVEHQEAKKLMTTLKQMSPEDEFYKATVTVLSEQIDHHVGEEENKIFPQVKKTHLDLRMLGDDIKKTKEKVIQ